jgi:CDP-glucose 4,6-dehydratase
MFGDCYRDRRVLLTGHTGFKGSWLTLWLTRMGAHVTGLALAPETSPSHWDLLNLNVNSITADIRSPEAVAEAVKKADPEIVFHLAAQSLVRRSYLQPRQTWETNVMGTVNLLEACRDRKNLRAIVVVTTDKCYENAESAEAYQEDDRLGGHDAYSASKAAVELAVASYRDAFFSHPESPLIATARAGNVIGGGDWADNRLIPDLARALAAGKTLEIRSPNAVRPWQHVLEPLSGYLLLGQKLFERTGDFSGAWNFGPDANEAMTVEKVLERLRVKWPDVDWKNVPDTAMHETLILLLDSAKARHVLGWKPVLDMDQQLDMTAAWYRAYLERQAVTSMQQLDDYQKAAGDAGASWA